MELKIEAMQTPAPIVWNYEELKAVLTERVKNYETVVYADDEIKKAKADRAALNKLSKALNDERIKREKEYNAPFAAFKSQVKELCDIIDRGSAAIDRQVKQDEERQKQKKREEIEAWWNFNRADLGAPDFLNLAAIADPKWLNASNKDWKDEIDARVQDIRQKLASLASLPEFSHEAVKVYEETLEISTALNQVRILTEAKKRREAEEEARQKAEEAQKAQIAALEAQEATKRPEPVETPAEASKAPETAQACTPETTDGQIWALGFRVYVNMEQARALRKFFDDNGIKFEKIEGSMK